MRDGSLRERAGLAAALLLLEREPVGVAWAEVGGPWARPASALYFCAAVALASRGRAFILTASDVRCGAARRVLGLEGARGSMSELAEEYASYRTYADAAAARAALESAAALEPSGEALAVAPLDSFLAEGRLPDAVVVVGTPRVAMRLVQGWAYRAGEPTRSTAIGMHGMCSEAVARAIATGAPNVGLLCSGARHFGMFAEGELAVGFPGALLEAILAGVIATADACEDDRTKALIRRRLAAEGIDFPLADRAGYIYDE